MVNRFVELVKGDSISSGEDFDVSYATKIIALSFDGEGELRQPVVYAVSSESEFDDWLAGFDSEQS